MKLKLEINDELKLYLEEMKAALAGVSAVSESFHHTLGDVCGGYCRNSCSNYCRPDCYNACDGACTNIAAAACEIRMIFPWPM